MSKQEKEKRASEWAIKNKIARFKIIGKEMIYKESFQGIVCSDRWTKKHIVNLETMDERIIKLHRFDKRFLRNINRAAQIEM